MKKIFGIGLSRTATTTLTNVLNQIGLKHIHYPQRKEEIFSPNNNGCSDISVIPYYKELDKKFPNSKFVYTIRDKASWIDIIEPYLERKRNWAQSKWAIDLRTKIYGAPFFDYKLYSEAYDKHDLDVRNYFKNRPNDLLILDIIGGDKPQKLYDFLEIDKRAPEVFPVFNKLKDSERNMRVKG